MPLTKSVLIPQPGTPYDTVRHTFRGGLNNSVGDEQIGLDELSLVENYIPDLMGSGEIIKREGLTASSSVKSEAWTSVYQGKNENYASTSTTICDLAGGALDTGLTSSASPDWVTFFDNDIFCNGAEVRTSTDGSTFAALGGTPPAFKYMAAHNNFLFGAGHSLGVLRWADYGTVATWNVTNALTITNDEGNDITGLTKFRNVLVVFCKNSFHHVNGTSSTDMSITHNAYGLGCTSNRSIVVTPFALFWWSDAGLVMSRSGFDTDVVFPTAAKIPSTLSSLNKAKYNLVHGVWDPLNRRVQYWVHNGLLQATFNLRIDYYYDERIAAVQNTPSSQGTLWTHTGKGAQMGASGAVRIDGEWRIYVGADATSNSYLYYQDSTVNTDSGTAINALLETARYAPVNPSALKKLCRQALHTVLTGQSTIDLSVYIDNSITIDKTWTINLSGFGGFIIGVSLLGGPDVLSSGSEHADDRINWETTFTKLKYRISDSTSVRTKLRGITHDGYVVHA